MCIFQSAAFFERAAAKVIPPAGEDGDQSLALAPSDAGTAHAVCPLGAPSREPPGILQYLLSAPNMATNLR